MTTPTKYDYCLSECPNCAMPIWVGGDAALMADLGGYRADQPACWNRCDVTNQPWEREPAWAIQSYAYWHRGHKEPRPTLTTAKWSGRQWSTAWPSFWPYRRAAK